MPTATAGRTYPQLTVTSLPTDTLAVLWNEAACRARLASVAQGWLDSRSSLHGQIPVVIAAVEGPHIVFLAPETEHLGGTAPEGPVKLQVDGVTPNMCHWVIRATGLVQPAIPSGLPGLASAATIAEVEGRRAPAVGG